ncbi:hypothetical protein [Bacillus sp. B15-48]|uniref:hypothetical protein n=1 Tax=Bacillus sp. B15-48 TaxID=1548601 RepID=UPI00193EDCC8|nr:hypothetical protein [Bacillus sp. B15-48]MBM4763804.1 hypothetical protein [Bacillus sp. B15-48]
MAINEGRQAHEHGLNALSYLLNESWSFEVLGLVRYELGQAYYKLNKHLMRGKCSCGDSPVDLELYKSLIIDVNDAISTASISPIPIVVEDLKRFLKEKKQSHRCIRFTLKKHAMTYDI